MGYAKGSGILMALEGKATHHLGSGLYWELSLHCPISTISTYSGSVEEIEFPQNYFPVFHTFLSGNINYHICSICPVCTFKFVEFFS